jgi:O-antigen/teichoic acid export membrane protein
MTRGARSALGLGRGAPGTSGGPTPSARELAGHASWNYSALVAQLAGSLALVALAFHRLPASDVGVFSLAAVTVGLLQILDPAAGYVMSRVVAGGEVGGAEPGVLASVQAGLRTLACALAGVAVLVLGAYLAVGSPGLGPARVVMVAGVVLAAAVQLGSASLPAVALGLGDFRGLFLASSVTAVMTLAAAWLLLPPTGVAALGIALLIGQVAGRACLLVRLHAGVGPVPRPARGPLGLAAVRELWRHTGAVYLSSLASALLAVSDLWTVGALRGVDATAAYRAGSMIPTQASALFYRVYDVLYPRLPQMADPARQERTIALATRVFSAAAGGLFTALFLARGPLTHLLVGRTDALTEQVFALFCAIWLVNVPVHGVALLLISRGHNAVMTPVVLVEAGVNIVISIGLVAVLGPIGAAVGTLATLAVSNLVVLPLIVTRLVPRAVRMTWSGAGCCVLGVAVGAVLQTPAALGLRGPTGLVVLACAGVLSALAAAWLAAGNQGRQVLRAHV